MSDVKGGPMFLQAVLVAVILLTLASAEYTHKLGHKKIAYLNLGIAWVASITLLVATNV